MLCVVSVLKVRTTGELVFTESSNTHLRCRVPEKILLISVKMNCCLLIHCAALLIVKLGIGMGSTRATSFAVSAHLLFEVVISRIGNEACLKYRCVGEVAEDWLVSPNDH